ncbi:Crp/Fnr family transcriptional regulator [Segetibacter sp. 3557_3]|uniref:Crp/Fnr family transcriptional regulator n=1 Tax=Segetibacter sp. 3557_3 TaxID=2547429 RepID=UPI001058D8C3|nr:Crp/Fnr family transcriptional regulator [Segetibacter sp. 3557_3]TDH18147.1 Crp/Fnr family transcriptional regulator [Segetibacter sp. 3557_3]
MERLLGLLASIHPLSPALEQHLSEIIQRQLFPKKCMLLKAGHTCRHIRFVEQGLARCYHNENSKEVSSWFMKEGDVFISVESFYQQKPSIESIQALEDCHVYSIEYAQLQHIYSTYPEFNIIGRILTERYYQLAEQRSKSLRSKSARERYAYLLNNHPELIQRVPSKYLSSYLGITEETLSRIRSKM